MTDNSQGLDEIYDIDKVIGAEVAIEDNEEEINKGDDFKAGGSDIENSFDVYNHQEYYLNEDSDTYSQQDGNNAAKRLASLSALDLQSVIESDNSLKNEV